VGMTFLLALLPGFLLLGLFTGGGLAADDEFDEDGSDDATAGGQGGGGQSVMPSVLSHAETTDADADADWDDAGWDQQGDDTASEDAFEAAFPPEPEEADLIAAEAMAALEEETQAGAAFPDNFNVMYEGVSTEPAMIADFDAGSEVIEIVLDQGISGGPLAAEASEDGADTAITMGGVPVVVLQGVNAADVDLSRVSVNRLS
jgi:hypothetical protein